MTRIAGNRKPAVFPLPVCAHAIKSRPALPTGICFCIGVGLEYASTQQACNGAPAHHCIQR